MIKTLCAALVLAGLAGQDSADPHRQFDFWIGEWSVQNRHMQADATWEDGDLTRARITPVCGGRALLEEWAGPFGGGFMNGFSLRAYDPARGDWDLLLFWTTDGNGGFGKLRGSFRHGRGEFFSGSGKNLTRYSFSDGLPNSVRWDSATTQDGGLAWKTDWIMEFSRTRAAKAVTQDRLFDVQWTEGKLSPHAEARELDWMLGEWKGTQIDHLSGVKSAARLRSKLLDKDCLVLDVLETGSLESRDWNERLSVRGYVAQRGSWESHSLAADDTVIRRSLGSPKDGVAIFEAQNGEGATRRETLRRLSETSMVIEEAVKPARAEAFELLRTTQLERVD